MDDAGFANDTPEASDDKPFDDEPFDAGVEADEDTDPKKYIEQLTGKLGQSLRKYTESKGQPDFDLEKFAINSLLSATHTSEMDGQDQKDIIAKIKEAGQGDGETQETNPMDDETPEDLSGSEDSVDDGFGDEGELEEIHVFENMDNLFVNPKKNDMFQPNSNDKLNESCWKGYKQVGMKEKDGKEVPNCVPIEEDLDKSQKNSIFEVIKNKLKETFNQEDIMNEPQTMPEPKVAPTKPAPSKVEPMKTPSRKNKPFLPMPTVQPDPKAMSETKMSSSGYQIYHKTLSSTFNEMENFVIKRGYEPIEIELSDVQHVKYETTANYTKELFKDGKLQRVGFHAQVYRMPSGNYELNMYIG